MEGVKACVSSLMEMGGYQVLAQLRQENIQTPVLILTAKFFALNR